MKHLRALLWLVAGIWVAQAWAQEEAAPPSTPAVTVTPAPAADVPTTANLPAIGLSTEGNFPPLPLSRPCTQQEVVGQVWALRQVFEKPAGADLKNFQNKPFQYLMLKDDSTYKLQQSAKPAESRAAVVDAMKAPPQANNLTQFVFQDNTIYFYKNSEVADSQVCFVVTSGRGDFIPGQMLLMPPIDKAVSSGVRLVKVYEKVNRGNGVQGRKPGAREAKGKGRRHVKGQGKGRKHKRNRNR